MKRSIVEGGGWPQRTAPGRPRLRLFLFLSLVWTTVSIVASIPFWSGAPLTWGSLEVLSAVLLALHFVWVALALRAWLTETPGPVDEGRGSLRQESRRLDLRGT